MEHGHPYPRHPYMMNSSKQQWRTIQLTISPIAVEAAEFALNLLDSLGTETELIRRDASEVVVTAYFDRMPDAESVQDELHYALRSYGLDESSVLNIERKIVENTDWLAEWKTYWKPTVVGNFVIAAPWHEVNEPGKIVIRIEPNMAFGTGTHETTQLCLEAIDKYYEPDDSFLDVGTGTGILAIAAVLKYRNTSGNECVVQGYDTDPESVKIACENAAINYVGDAIEFRFGSINGQIPNFDLVCANLTFDVILPILQLLLEISKRFLVLSGILAKQEEAIRNSLADFGFADPVVVHAGEWIAIVVKKVR